MGWFSKVSKDALFCLLNTEWVTCIYFLADIHSEHQVHDKVSTTDNSSNLSFWVVWDYKVILKPEPEINDKNEDYKASENEPEDMDFRNMTEIFKL